MVTPQQKVEQTSKKILERKISPISQGEANIISFGVKIVHVPQFDVCSLSFNLCVIFLLSLPTKLQVISGSQVSIN